MAQSKIQVTTTPPLPGTQLVKEINNALETIATDFSGAIDPAANAFAYSLWADTGTGDLKRRNAANSAWTTIGRIYPAVTEDASGNVTFPGTVSVGGGLLSPQTGFKNRIINGNMVIDQRNAGASITFNDGVYVVDRFGSACSQASKATAQQSTTAPTGFTNSIQITSSSAYSVAAGDFFNLYQNIEGLNVFDFAWGTANAQPITISFWVRSSLTGTFGGSISNSGLSRSYPFTYTISAANTYEYKTITIPGDTSGTWLTTNGIGLRVYFGLGVGTTYSGTAGAWAATRYQSATGAVSLVGTNGATWNLSGLQLEKGSVATPFEFRSIGQELALCQRYLELISSFEGSTIPSGQTGRLVYSFKVTKRASPTVALGAASNGTIAFASVEGCQLQSGTAGSGPYFGNGGARAEIEL